MTVAEYLAEVLKQNQVSDAFGVPGGVILPLIYAMENTDGMEPHLCYSEQGAGFAACGFAQASDMSSNTALHLEDEIKGVFAGMDNLGEVILNKIASRDSTGEINRSVANLDIQSDILRSIASHDRSDEISEYNSYNASRIASYKNAGGSTSVFGDFKL